MISTQDSVLIVYYNSIHCIQYTIYYALLLNFIVSSYKIFSMFYIIYDIIFMS